MEKIMMYFINLTLFAIVIYFAYKNYTLTKEKVIKEIDKEFLRLPVAKYDAPIFEDFDPKHNLLKDILESLKIEDWTNKIEQERSYGLSDRKTYTIELYNPSNTLRVKSRLYVYDAKVNLAMFSVARTLVNTPFNSGSVSYNTDNPEVNALILSKLWSYILEYHENIYNETLVGYKTLAECIDTELKTLKRDKALKTLLG